MAAFSGRAIFVVDIAQLIDDLGVQPIVTRLEQAHCSELWIRIGRGVAIQPGLTAPLIAPLQQMLARAGIGLCGWHVPFCKDADAAHAEVDRVIFWAEEFGLRGIVADAERTPDSPRFQGGAPEATLYTDGLKAGLDARGIALAFSSHDQPDLHRDLPFAEFLAAGQPALPQVYNRGADPVPRLGKSERGYANLLGADFATRYRPTANVTTAGDIAFPDEATCLRSLDRFLDHVAQQAYLGYSLWCWEDATPGLWAALAARPA